MKIALQILLFIFIFGFLIDALTSKEDGRRLCSFGGATVLIILLMASIMRL